MTDMPPDPPSAPDPAGAQLGLVPGRTSLESLLGALKDMLPSLAIAVSLPLLVLFAMPAGNEKVVLSIVSGIFGFLTGRATAPKGDGQ